MKKTGRPIFGAVFAAAVLTLSAHLLLGQDAAKKPPRVSMGTYTVTGPPGGGWDIDIGKDRVQVTFSKSRGRGALSQMFPALAPRVRDTTIVVFEETLGPDRFMMSEEQVAKKCIDEYYWETDVDRSGLEALAKRDVIDREGKRLHFAKWNGPHFIRPGKAGRDEMVFHVYLYFPPGFRNTHRFFHFQSVMYRPEAEGDKPDDPGLEPVLGVIDSLEIVDPLRAVPGPHGDLLRAAAAGRAEGVLQATEQGADISAGGPERGALSVAAGAGRREIVDLLIEGGAAIDTPDTNGGMTPLLSAIIACEPGIAALFIEKGADLDRRIDRWGRKGLSPLMLAAAIGPTDLARALIEGGAEVDAKSGQGETALFFAAESGMPECVALLIGKGADVNARSGNGWTSLMRAVDNSHAEVVEMLLENKADPNLTQADDGWAAVFMAARDKQHEILKALIDRGADINARWTGDVVTALNGAVVMNALEIATLLARAGADVNTKMKDGRTALIAATENGSVDMVKLLIESGADPNATNAKGQTALKIATKKKAWEVFRLLKAAGAK